MNCCKKQEQNSWGLLWDHHRGKLLSLLSKDEESFICFQNANEEIILKKIKSSSIVKYSSKPTFKLEWCRKEMEFTMETKKPIDPKLEDFHQYQPGFLQLSFEVAEYKFHRLPVSIFIFQENLDNKLRKRSKGKLFTLSKLGKGSFGVVFKCYSTVSCQLVAAKTLKKTSNMDQWKSRLECLKYEKNFLLSINHKNIIGIIAKESSISDKIVCLDLSTIGALTTFMDDKPIAENLAKLFVKDIISGLGELHLNNFLHRDLKPENMLVFNQDGHYSIKISDFGSVTKSYNDPRLLEIHGTAVYSAPEIAKYIIFSKLPEYKKSSDIFTVGSTLYRIIYNRHAFYIQYTCPDFRKKLKNGTYSQSDLKPSFENSSPELMSFFYSCCCIDEQERLTVDELASHPWLK